MKRPFRLLIPLAAALTLSACDRRGTGLGAGAMRELGEIRFDCTAMEGELTQEYLELFSRVQATGDVRATSMPHRITLLHLAALHKKPQLVDELLLAGADPNARTLVASMVEGEGLVEGDTVLACALMMPEDGEAPATVLIPLIDRLCAAEADVRALDAQGLPLLVLATLNPHPEAEEVFLHLLGKGAVLEGEARHTLASSLPLGAWVAARCWKRALTALLDRGYAVGGLLPELARHAGEPDALDCARLVLERGARAGECTPEGTPALYEAANALRALRDEGASADELDEARAMVLFLLQSGAEASQPCGAASEAPGSCAADLLREDAAVLAAMAEAGLPPLPPLALDFSGEGEALLSQICRAGRLDDQFGDEVLLPHADRLAALLAKPGEELQQSVLFPMATGEALRLLARVDAARAARLLVQHSCWKDADWDEEGSVNAVLLHVAENDSRLVLPAHFLQAQAVAREAAGQPDIAATLIEMLARDPSAEAAIARLCADERLPLRVGALTARLLRAGLPAPRDGCVADWAAVRGLAFEDAPPAVQTAWLATSLEEIWLGEADKARQEAIVAALRALGAERAANFFTHPEMEATDEMSLELEELTAKFIWENRAGFQQLVPPES